MRIEDSIAEYLFTYGIRHYHYGSHFRLTNAPGEGCRSGGDIRGLRIERSEHRITDRLHAQVIDIDETRSRLEEHDILALRSGQRQLEQFPITETGRVIVHVSRSRQISMRITQSIDDFERTEVARIR